MLVDRVNPITGKLYYKFTAQSDSNYYDIPGDVKDQKNRNYAGAGSGRGVWRIGALPAGKRIGMGIAPDYEWSGSGAPDATVGSNPNRLVAPLAVEISSRQRDPHPENNRDAAGLLIKNTGNYRILSAFNTLLEAQADNLRPANNDGQAVNFTLKLENLNKIGLDLPNYTSALLSDVKLDITLSGLKVKTKPTDTELNGTTIQCQDSGKANDTLGDCAEGDDSAEWSAGFLYASGTKDCDDSGTGQYDCRELTLKLALDGDSYDDGKEIPLAERCLEARLRSVPPPDPGDWRGGPVKVCLGADDPPRLLLEEGRADIYTFYPCVDAPSDEVADALVTTYPCDDTDTFEAAAAIEHPSAVSRRSDILGNPANNKHSGKAVVKTGYTQAGSKVNAPETQVTIQVKDPGGRAFDSNAASVNGSSVVSWHTARTSSGGSTGIKEVIPGVLVFSNWATIAAQYFNSTPYYNWGPTIRIISVSGLGDASNPLPTPHYSSCVDPEAISSTGPITDTDVSGLPALPAAPGVMAFRRQGGNGYQDIKNSTTIRHGRTFSFAGRNFRPSNPSDRVFEFEKLGTYVVDYHFTAQYTRTPKNGNDYCTTARYVFHAGPVAELAVQNGTPPAGGYQVVARNNGPDPAERAQVHLNVTGMQATASVGRWDPATGIWDLSQAWDETNQQWVATKFYPDDEATLTFGAGSSRVTATIANHEQCVDEDGAVVTDDNGDAITTELACIYSDPTATPPTRSGHHWGSYSVCVDYDSSNTARTNDYIRLIDTDNDGTADTRAPITTENECTDSTKGGDSSNTWDVGTVYDYDERNNTVVLQPGPTVVTPDPDPPPPPPSPDQHGDTADTATLLAMGHTADGRVNTRRDLDYFHLRVPQAGWLVIATTGWTNTQGTLYDDDGQVIAHAILGGPRRNFQIVQRVPAGDYSLAVTGARTVGRVSMGHYTVSVDLVVGFVDSPQPDTAQSGVGILYGWVCVADTVEFAFNDHPPLPAATGAERPDTLERCGHEYSGFELPYNWNRLGDGTHDVTLVVNGVRLETIPVSVTTLGAEFRRGLQGETTVEDFPSPGESVRLVWQEGQQNFALATGESTGSGTHRDPTQAMLERPRPGSYQSGIGGITGWVCEAESVTVEVGDRQLVAGYGFERPDTRAACGDTANGFGLTVNWAALGTGEHTVRLLVDNTEWATATFLVTSLGEAFIRGAAGTAVIGNFPRLGEAVTVEWQEAQQNFVVTGWER